MEPTDPQTPPMSFWQHVEAFRAALVASAFIFLTSCIGIGVFLPQVTKWLMWPLKKAMVEHPHLLQGLVTTSPMGIFSVLIQVCLLGGFSLSLPLMLWPIAQFIAPALTPKEKKALFPSILAAFLLFLMGALFSYFWLLPTSLSIAIDLNQLFGFELIWSAPHYYGLVVWMTFGMGLCFEFPLILIILIALNILKRSTLIHYRRHILIGILILAAFITPGGDPLSLIMVAIPLYILFELSLLISKKFSDENT
jgi:sec-independent protein translocase protein TatC